MPAIEFYRQATPAATSGAVTFSTSGGIYVGTGSSTHEVSTLVTFTPKTTGGISIGTLTLNGVNYELYYQPSNNTYVAGEGVSISNNNISIQPATSTTYGGVKLKFESSTLEIIT